MTLEVSGHWLGIRRGPQFLKLCLHCFYVYFDVVFRILNSTVIFLHLLGIKPLLAAKSTYVINIPLDDMV